MNHREEITAELKQIDPSMTQWPFHMPYRVPAGYFNAITEKLLECALIGLHIEKSQCYKVPAGYFDQLPEFFCLLRSEREMFSEIGYFQHFNILALTHHFPLWLLCCNKRNNQHCNKKYDCFFHDQLFVSTFASAEDSADSSRYCFNSSSLIISICSSTSGKTSIP